MWKYWNLQWQILAWLSHVSTAWPNFQRWRQNFHLGSVSQIPRLDFASHLRRKLRNLINLFSFDVFFLSFFPFSFDKVAVNSARKFPVYDSSFDGFQCLLKSHFAKVNCLYNVFPFEYFRRKWKTLFRGLGVESWIEWDWNVKGNVILSWLGKHTSSEWQFYQETFISNMEFPLISDCHVSVIFCHPFS